MASLATYAKLTAPGQFQPTEIITFRMQYSEDLVLKYATLVIDGYEQTSVQDPSKTYSGTKITYQLMGAIAGQWFIEFTVPANTLGFVPNNNEDYYSSGKMQARVEIGSEREGGHVINPVFTSNVVLVDMLIMRSGEDTFAFTGLPYNARGSVYSVRLYCDYIKNYGTTGDAEIQSYRITLYDLHKNRIFESDEMYNWDDNIYRDRYYTLYNLKDNTTYYVKARAVLNGGYILQTDYTPIEVSYETIPSVSDIFVIRGRVGGAEMSIDLTGITHTRVVFSRTVMYEADYLEVADREDTDDIVSAIDKYVIPNRQYLYRAIVYNGDTIIATYYNYLTYKNNFITISDADGLYTAVSDLTKHPINRNDRGSILETMDSKYPFNIINGEPDYDSGQVEGMFSDMKDDCTVDMNNVVLSNILRAWLNNGKAKLLTYYTGEAWLVSVSGVSTSDPNNDDVYNTRFNWTEIGDADRPSEYVRLGLITNG